MGKRFLNGLATGAGIMVAVLFVISIAVAADIFTIDRDGTVRLRVGSSGNVGIGTAGDATSRLEVRGNGTTSATSALNVTASDGTSRLFVRDDGNVGIGTTSPGQKLEVAGDLKINDGAYFANASGRLRVYRATVPASSTIYVPDADIPRGCIVNLTEDGGYRPGIFSTFRDGTYNGTRLIADPSGSFGFGGTSDPGTGGEARFWIEDNNPGGRLAIRNMRTWAIQMVLYCMSY